MSARITCILLAAAIATGACGSDSTDSGSNGPVGTVTVGNNFFQSGHNGTQNPAVDTVAVGGTVTWTWTGTGGTSHSVRSEDAQGTLPSFTSSQVLTGNGQTYSVTFTAAGTYQYDCAVHGALMTGTVVVQ